MKSIVFITAAILIAVIYSCTNQPTDKTITKAITNATAVDSAVGKIEIYDSSAIRLIDSNATLQVIGKGFTWSEGPVWIAAKHMLLFTDVPENKIFQWKEGDTTKLYLTPSGYTGAIKRDGGEDGANGLTLDKDGRLLLCQSGNRQVVRLNASLEVPRPDFTVLSANYNGKRYNSPNDLVADSKGNIYWSQFVS
jgi:gluconolactonase